MPLEDKRSTLRYPDNVKLILGSDGDIEFYFDGTDVIVDATTGTPDWDMTDIPIKWGSTGRFPTATDYSIGRNSDPTNRLQYNVPTGTFHEFSINGVALFSFNITTIFFNAAAPLLKITDTGDSSGVRYQTITSGALSARFLDNAGATLLTIWDGGDIGVGDAVESSANGGKVMLFGDNGADPTMGANTAGVYGKDVAGTVELFAVDEAGNATQLSPHGFDAYAPDPTHVLPWTFSSENSFIGKRISVDMYGVVAAIERLTGQTLMYFDDFAPISWDETEAAKVAANRLERRRTKALEEPQPPVYRAKEMPAWIAERVTNV